PIGSGMPPGRRIRRTRLAARRHRGATSRLLKDAGAFFRDLLDVMPIHYERDDRKRRIVITSAGPVTAADALAIIDRQAAEGAWTYSVLYDTRAGLDLPTPADLHQLLLRVGVLTTKHGPRGPVAFVVHDPAL